VIQVELIVTTFLAIIFLALLISTKAKIPYTIILVLFGVLIVFLSDKLFLGSGLLGSTIFAIRSDITGLSSGQNGGLFVGLVVPPLIFEAMTHVSSDDLREVIRPSFVLATVGVVIATVVGGLLLWWIVGLPFFISFLFAAVISPTDTATVLELFRRLSVPSRLSALLDTEAAFNDATGIVIFTIILSTALSLRLPLFSSALNFTIIFGGGIAIGLVLALAAELLTSIMNDRLAEVILTIFVVYGSYVLASEVGASGLIAVTVVGLYFGNYTIKSAIRPANREAIRVVWEVAAFIGNSVAFLFIGLRTDVLRLYQSTELIGVAFIAIFVARASTVYPILTIFDRIRRKAGNGFPLSWRNVAMLGGVRGALSIALSASISGSGLVSSADSDIVTTMVLGVAFISILFQTSVLSRYIRRVFKREEDTLSSLRQHESITARLEKSASTIESLKRMREKIKISEEEFVSLLEKEKAEVDRLLTSMVTDPGNTTPSNILRSRSADLYDSVIKSSNLARLINDVRNREKNHPKDNEATES